jgi:uncharacterized protein YbjT (DUF2867 family)
VSALVRPGTDASKLRQLGMEIVEGDLLDRASLVRVMPKGGVVIHTAIGYSNRRKGDSGGGADTVGTQNLADAARDAGVRKNGRGLTLGCLECANVRRAVWSSLRSTSWFPACRIRRRN